MISRSLLIEATPYHCNNAYDIYVLYDSDIWLTRLSPHTLHLSHNLHLSHIGVIYLYMYIRHMCPIWHTHTHLYDAHTHTHTHNIYSIWVIYESYIWERYIRHMCPIWHTHTHLYDTHTHTYMTHTHASRIIRHICPIWHTHTHLYDTHTHTRHILHLMIYLRDIGHIYRTYMSYMTQIYVLYICPIWHTHTHTTHPPSDDISEWYRTYI